MLNSQPLGFYSPSQRVQDAQRHGVVVRAVDVMCSDLDCTMEEAAVRLGLRIVAGLATAAALRIVEARTETPFTSTEDLALRAGLDQGDLKALASADALISLSGHRRQQAWDASALRPAPGLHMADFWFEVA